MRNQRTPAKQSDGVSLQSGARVMSHRAICSTPGCGGSALPTSDMCGPCAAFDRALAADEDARQPASTGGRR